MGRKSDTAQEAAFGRAGVTRADGDRRFPNRASTESTEKNAGSREVGGFILDRVRRIVRQVRTFRTISGAPRTSGCSSGAHRRRSA